MGMAGCPAGPAAVAPKGKAAPPAPVTVAQAVATDVPVVIRTFGLVEANAMVDVRSQTTGLLVDVAIREGQEVAKGDLMFRIDPKPAEAGLKQAEAVLARDRATLADAEREAGRQKELLGKGLAAPAEEEKARTAAEALAASVRAGQAAVEQARIELDYCSIRAPFDGRTGELRVDEGNLVRANDAVLTTLNQVRPAQVSFTVPQAEAAVLLDPAALTMAVRVMLPGAEDRPEDGRLVFVDNAVDVPTGSLRCKGLFANAAGRLWPGQHVKVELKTGVESNAVVVPAQAVQVGQQGAYVFALKDDGSVEQRPVAAGRPHAGGLVIGRGLAAGEKVVTDGQFRLTPGARVEVKPTPPTDPAPHQ